MKKLLLLLALLLLIPTPSWARIVTPTGGAVATGTTSLAVPFPASVLAGDLLFLCVVNKYPTNAPTLPTDAFGGTWVAVTNGQSSGGFGVDGADLGHVYVTWFYKVATGTETGDLTVSIPSGNSSVGRMSARRNSTGLWSVTAANAAVNTSSLSWSAVGNVDPGVTVGDLIIVVSGSYTDAAAFSAHAFTQTGVTDFGTVTEGFDQAVTDGDDMKFVFASATVVAGTSSAADLTYTATASALTGGSSAFLRIREVTTSSPATFGSIGTIGTGSTSITPAYPASITAGDLLVLCVANKYPNNGPSTPADWTAVSGGQVDGGTGAAGVSVGHAYATVFTTVATGSESGTLTVSIPSANQSAAAISRYSNTTLNWLVAADTGADTTDGTGYSITGASDPGVTANDLIMTCTATNSSTSLFTETTEVLTQTGITSYGLSNERLDSGSTGADRVGIKIVDFVALAGTSSSVQTYAATITSLNGSGGTVLLRIREQPFSMAPQSGQGFLGAIIQ